MIGSATFSPDPEKIYRYLLRRKWNDGKSCVFIGLNPSTADETKDDPTIRRCIRFAQDWGFAQLYMLNLFAYRATDPKVMMAHPSPIGPDNMDYMERRIFSGNCGMVVAAWGVHGAHLNQGAKVREHFRGRLHHLGLTKEGFPKHPLYLKADTKPTLWT